MAEKKKRQYSEAQNKATQKYIKENLEEIKFRVRKGEKDKYRTAAEKSGLGVGRRIKGDANCGLFFQPLSH